MLNRKLIFFLSPRPWGRLYHNLDEDMKELARGFSAALVLQVIGAGLGFAINVVLSRILGAEGTGIYYLAFTIMTIASTLARMGLDNSLIRFIASNSEVGDWNAVKGVYIKGVFYALGCSFLLTFLIAILAPWIARVLFNEPNLSAPLRLITLAIIPFAMFVLHGNALMGLKQVPAAVSIQNVWAKIFALLGIVVLTPFWGVKGAVCSYISAAFATMALAIWLWRKTTPQLRDLCGRFSTKILLESCIPLFGVLAFNLAMTWSSILFLGVWTDSASVGIFSVAHRTALLMVFFLHAINSIAAPKFSAMYKRRDMKNMERVARNAAKFLMVVSSPLLLLFLLMPHLVMRTFGTEFVQGTTVLAIMAVGQFINVSTGSVGYLLMMSGYEKLMRDNLALCAIMNIILNIVLIPRAGITGAAIATASTLAIQNVIAAGLVWNKLGIVTLPFIPRSLPLKRSNS